MNEQQFMMPFPMPVPAPAPALLPERIRAAMGFIGMMTEKTAESVAVNDVAFEKIPAQKLTVGEEGVLEAACEMLIAYFQGKLPLDEREQQKGGMPPNGSLIRCPACGGGGQQCPLCGGKGRLMVYPIG